MMKAKRVFAGLGLIALGCVLGIAGSTIFFQKITTASLNARLLGDLSQDVAMFSTLKSSKHDASITLSKNRLESSLTGLKAQWRYLTEKDKILSNRIMSKAKGKDAEIDDVIGNVAW